MIIPPCQIRSDHPAVAWLSHLFTHVPQLIPLLAEHYHVVAPDLPGFRLFHYSQSKTVRYNFENLAKVIGKFSGAIGLERFAIYVFDYGAPVGLRLALAYPERITAIISQNGNAYEEGLSEGWNPNPEVLERAHGGQSQRATRVPEVRHHKWQYTHGLADASQIAPENCTLDAALLARPGNDEIQLDPKSPRRPRSGFSADLPHILACMRPTYDQGSKWLFS